MNTRELSEANWNRDKEKWGWELPPAAPWPFRLPLIRNLRAAYHTINIARHEAMMARLGFGTWYDQWVLYAIKRGWC